MLNIDRRLAKELLVKLIDSEIFTATFIKKSGELRTMNCRKHVKKHLAGGKLKYNAIERNLLPVFDMQKQAYRMINIETLQNIKARGKEYSITD